MKPFTLSSKILSKTLVFFAVVLINLYRLLFSGLTPACRFTPTCSVYSREALKRFGFFKGSLMTLHRLGRCHPWGGFGYDPVSQERKDNFVSLKVRRNS